MATDAQSIKGKSLLGLTFLMVILGLSLFMTAGTFDFWQAWVYLILFFVSSLFITVWLLKRDRALLERRIKASSVTEKERGQTIVQIILRVVFIGIFLISGLDRRLGWSDVPSYVVIISDIFFVLGLYIIFLVFRENSFASALIETAEGQTVISTGPYAVVRHPMYSGALLMLFFSPLALGSYWGVLLIIPMFISIAWRLLDEEKFLAKNLPGYLEYCEKNRYRLIPFIW